MSRRFSIGHLFALIFLTTAAAGGAQEPVLVPDWRELSRPPFPLFDVPGFANPVLSADDVTDTPAVSVADPFLFRENAGWYLFFEVYRSLPLRAAIALATSHDGVNWDYDRVILEHPGLHFSFPCVFKWDGSYYLLPDVWGIAAVRLYKASAEDFPHRWTMVANLISGQLFADPTLFRHAGLWWIFVANSNSNTCQLYYSAELENPAAWTAHPASPIVLDDRTRARPGGRVVVLADGRIFRPAQKCWPLYGESLRLFEVTELTAESYAEREVPESPILLPSGSGWNAERMHQYDPWWTGSRWLVAVDGNDSSAWSIGIYLSDIESGIPSLPPAHGLILSCRPNPFNPATTFDFTLPKPSLARLSIHDPGGRLLATLCDEPLDAGRHSLTWDASHTGGRASTTGLYLARLEAGEEEVQIKLMLLK